MKFWLLVPALAALLLVSAAQVQSGPTGQDDSSTRATEVCRGSSTGTYMPDPDDCGRYYICLGSNNGYENLCPPYFYFHPTSLKCVALSGMPSNATCLRDTCLKKPDGTYLTQKNECQNYRICIRNEAVEETCPGDLNFHPETFQCVRGFDLPASHPCYPNTAWVPDCSGRFDGTRIEDLTDCNKYYICVGGKTKTFQCPSILYFHPENHVCVRGDEMPWDAQCSGNPGVTTTPGPQPTKPTEPENTEPTEPTEPDYP